ncbi:MAG: tRNA preQ1(34) S-adenosylmethionine ribosyltransferase-isomerase QueA [Opitutaceae bacterium]|nr:tRNA preQ1(34) S-adenosylmethionine ribosyltransferase-isomerase QueA [Opitutaceae bacterium]
MRTDDFDFDLPVELIAQNPVVPRDSSRLMLLNRKTGKIGHRRFFDLPDILQEGDVLVLNDTKVIPARLYGTIPEVGPGRVEVLLLNESVEGFQRVMAKPGKKFQVGYEVVFDDFLSADVVEVEADGCRLLQFNSSTSELIKHLDRIGHTPLPPYIKSSTASREQYQTVYAREQGSSAAPTAGLHFTEKVLEDLIAKEIRVEHVTLHVGRGTFQDVKVKHLKEHQMHSESFELSVAAAERINRAKQNGSRIVAVGTTSVRVLESCTNSNGRLVPQVSRTNIFIYPGYRWKIVDGLITNFHLPQSSLVMLVSSFVGRDVVFKAYEEAITKRYRFFSFGDAMFIS